MRHATSLSVFCLLCVLGPAASAGDLTDEQAVAQAGALIDSAKMRGQQYLQTKDKDAQKACKKQLEQAEKLLKKALDRNRGCESCAVALGSVYTAKTFFGIEKNYDDAIKFLQSAQSRFPDNPKIAYSLGFAYFGNGVFRESIRQLNSFLVESSGDPDREAYAHQLLKAAQQRFLSFWNNQADFYNSRESRIETFNSQTFRNDIIFQVTPDWENQLAAQSLTQITSQGSRISDAEVQGYMDQLVQRIVDRTPGSPYAYRVTVIDSPAVNAVTLPGHIVVYGGLLRFARTESELAAVLSHEIGHNYAHHAARRVIKAYQAQMLTNAIIKAVNPKSQVNQMIANIVGQIGLGLFVNAYSRFEESEADRYGAHIAFNAGYSPTALSGFLLHMYEANPKQPIKWLSTHPPLPKRVDELTEYIEGFPLEGEMRSDTEAFQRIKGRFGSADNQQPLPPIP